MKQHLNIPCPIDTVSLPKLEENLKLNGLIVVVGPNSSGKTQLLRDINEVVCGRPRSLVVASRISYNSMPSSNDFLNLLLKNNFLEECPPRADSEKTFKLPISHQQGTDTGISDGEFAASTFNSWHQKFVNQVQQGQESNIAGSELLARFGSLSCSALFLENRLTLTNETNNFDYIIQPAAKTLQSLHLSKFAQQKLLEEILNVFQRGVWLDFTAGNKLRLRVSGSANIPSPEERLYPEEVINHRTIENEGDGLRSYVALSITLLLKQTPLCLIDEPEMCLHPPQAHAAGRFIGNHTTTSEKDCTVVATHSSYVLRGILETKPEATVIRLTRTNSQFTANMVSADILQEAVSKPRSRSETILDGIFFDAVVLCESDGDRTVYEATYRTLQDNSLDIRFVPRNGAGALRDGLKLYQGLGVPAAIITDFDSLKDSGQIGQWLKELGVEQKEVKSLTKRCDELIKQITAEVSSISPEEVKIELMELAKEKWELPKDESKLRGRLTKLSKNISSFSILKSGGIVGAPREYQEKITSLLDELGAYGVFIVPCGELESWISVLMKGVPKNKNTWPLIAAEKIEEVVPYKNDVWEFIERVSQFLKNKKCEVR